MNIRATLALAATLSLLGCSSMPLSPLPRTPPDSAGQVVVFRESAFIASGVSLTVGANAMAFAYLSNDEQVMVELPIGEQEIFVQARTAEPSKVRINVQRGAPTCLRTSSNSNTVAKIVFPIALIATGYHFFLDPVPCPAAGELGKYKLVPVTYK